MSSPENDPLHARLQEFLRRNLESGSGFIPQVEQPAGEEPAPPPKAKAGFDFNLTPRQVKEHLDRFVIKAGRGQEGPGHHRLRPLSPRARRHAGQGGRQLHEAERAGHGPDRVGKTYLVKCLAELIGVPMVRADATKFTETGYVGGDVEDLVRDLVTQAEGDKETAQYGIIYLDEVDKLASSSVGSGRDVSGRGVQTNLLKLMEETEVPLRSQTDLQSQLQAAMEFQRRGGKVKKETINTRHILFIVSGAFDRLPEIVKRRMSKAEIGFAARAARRAPGRPGARRRDHAGPDRLLRHGAGVCRPAAGAGGLRRSRRRRPLRDPQAERGLAHPPVRGGLPRLRDRGDVTDDVCARWRGWPRRSKPGREVWSPSRRRTLRPFKFELPGSGVRRFVVHESLVLGPEAELRRILSDGRYEERLVMAEIVRQFAARFEEKHALRLELTPDGIDALVDGALQAERNMRDHCAMVFKDFEFGLKLVSKNSGQTTFTIDRDVVAAPDQTMSRWVVNSYKPSP
ncbi:MAG: AAA family ATPase [Verrucomicrobiota bacterium]